MAVVPEPLENLGQRIEKLTLDPDSISAPLTRMFRPLLVRIGWRPKSQTDATEDLISALRWAEAGSRAPNDCKKDLDKAIEELEDNLTQVERATVVARRPMVAHAAWLRRMYEILVHAHRAIGEPGDRTPLALAAGVDDAAVLPPLSMTSAREDDDTTQQADEPPGQGDPAAEPTEAQADPSRILELQLDTIDHLLGAAREEDALLGRRRRLLDAARQLLLESSAALALDERGVHERLQSIATQITRINRQQAVGLRPDVSLLHQARTALSRGERDKLFAALSAIDRGAVDRGDLQFAALTRASLQRLQGAASSAEAAEASIARSAQEMMGGRVIEAIATGAARAIEQREEMDDVNADAFAAEQVKAHYAPGKERHILAHTLTVDGCFDVGGVLSPVRIRENYIRHRVVPYPTQHQKLVRAQGPADLPTAIVHDPRAIILDLAAGRLLARRYIQDEIATRTRTAMQGEVRVYVLDGSSSMLGPRARMRDAILVAELATLLRRLENPDAHTRVVLYYRYFNALMGPVTRVDNPGAVIEAIADVTGTPKSGGTDIEQALLTSMHLIARAQEENSDLARAQIVLITDGNAQVDEVAITSARETLGQLPVGISVIALGEENEALRGIVARQRARHERAFYHFLPDGYLRRINNGELGGDAVHLPSVPGLDEDETLETELGALLEDLATLQASREEQARRELDRVGRDRRLERTDIEAAGEGERARLEALYRDDRALNRRFGHWFPEPPEAPEVDTRVPTASTTALVLAAPEEGTLERDDFDSVLVVLASITEVIEAVGSTRLGRQADAVDLLERLLPNARLTPARYHEVLRQYPHELAPALRHLHDAVDAGLGARIAEPLGRGRVPSPV